MISFYLDKNQSHGQDDRFLRAFLMKIQLCRPEEDLSCWQITIDVRKSFIVLFHKIKEIKIIIIDKTDLLNENLMRTQKEFIHQIIKGHTSNLISREKLIFIDLTDNVESDSIIGYQLLENRMLIEFMQWRETIEVKEWIESCLNFLEDGNWFKIELKNYIYK